MKNIFWVLCIVVGFSQVSFANWKALVRCNGAVVDVAQDTTPAQYQLVIKDSAAVDQFLRLTNVQNLVNSNSELIVTVQSQAGDSRKFITPQPISASRNGYTKRLEAEINGDNTMGVYVLGNGTTGPEKNRIGNFPSCSLLD